MALVRGVAARHNIAVHYPDQIDAGWTAKIAALRPAIIYSFSYRHLIAEAVLALAPIGAYNLHPSPLPRYRGELLSTGCSPTASARRA